MGRVMERILVLRLGHLGDVIHALPAVAALRDALPAARIGWAIEGRWTDLLFASGQASAPRGSPEKPLVDEVHRVSTEAWRRSPLASRSWSEAASAAIELRRARYDAVVDLQGLWKSVLISRWCRAPIRIGFDRPKETGVRWFYTRRVAARRAHVVEQNLELAEALTGRPAGKPRFPLPRDGAAEAWCGEELDRRGLTAFAMLSPGAGWGAKLWPAESYGGLARILLRQTGLPSLVNIGPEQEELARAVESASGGAARRIECSVGRLVALTRRCSLLLGGDTGPVHLAAVLGVPVVALYGPTSPARNGPYGDRTAVLRSAASRTSYAHVDRPDTGLRSIAPEEVAAAALRLLPAGLSAAAVAARPAAERVKDESSRSVAEAPPGPWSHRE
jgi:heptosyltransferase-1